MIDSKNLMYNDLTVLNEIQQPVRKRDETAYCSLSCVYFLRLEQ